MAKKIIFIAVMLLLLASLGLVLTVLNRPDSKSAADPVQSEQEYIIDLQGDEYQGLASVTIKNSTGEYTVISGSPPSIPGYEDYPIDTYALYRIVNTSAGLLSRGLVTDEETSLAPFGLDVPRAEIRVKPVRGDELVLYIGNPVPDGINAYVKKENSPAVYLAGQGETETYLKGIFDFIDTEISPPAADDGGGGFTFDRIILGGAVRQGEEVNIFVNENDESNPPGMRGNPIRISGPVDARFNMDRGYPIIQSIFGLRASRVAAKIDSNSDLAKWRLDKPWSTASVSGTVGQGLGGFALRVSKPDAAGKVYIQREGVDLVYEMEASQLPWLETSWFNLMDRLIIFPFIDLLSSVEVRSPARTVSFSLSGEGDDLKIKALNIDIDTANFRVYYQTLLSAAYDEVSAEKPAPGAKPVLEIIYHYRDGKAADTVSFYSTASRWVLTSFNGGRPFYTFAAYVDKVLGDLDQILAGKRVQSYL
ncbi:hypothetical protein FACS1894110_04790 [Spirochaetia bacterium]|nr:hypothetical protein FACS1894110_04790 [Spirochaetia bacterium]